MYSLKNVCCQYSNVLLVSVMRMKEEINKVLQMQSADEPLLPVVLDLVTGQGAGCEHTDYLPRLDAGIHVDTGINICDTVVTFII